MSFPGAHRVNSFQSSSTCALFTSAAFSVLYSFSTLLYRRQQPLILSPFLLQLISILRIYFCRFSSFTYIYITYMYVVYITEPFLCAWDYCRHTHMRRLRARGIMSSSIWDPSNQKFIQVKMRRRRVDVVYALFCIMLIVRRSINLA